MQVDAAGIEKSLFIVFLMNWTKTTANDQADDSPGEGRMYERPESLLTVQLKLLNFIYLS